MTDEIMRQLAARVDACETCSSADLAITRQERDRYREAFFRAADEAEQWKCRTFMVLLAAAAVAAWGVLR